MIYLSKEFHFHAAHFLKDHPGKCKNIHGHTYKLIVTLCGTMLGENGMLIDFGELKKIVKENIIDKVDHKLLNDVLKYTPTAEMMAMNFYYDLKGILNTLWSEGSIYGISLHKITIYETNTSCATYEEQT